MYKRQPCVAIAKRPAPDRVAAGSSETPRVEPLGLHHIRSEFSSGVEPLDRYFRTQAGQDARKNMAAPFVLILTDGTIAGYYTLSATAVPAPELPADTIGKLPRYPLIPATLLGRLAVDHRYLRLKILHLCFCERHYFVLKACLDAGYL